LRPRLADQAEREIRVKLAEFQQHFWKKRGDHVAALGRMSSKALDRRLFDARDLDLNVQESPIPVTREDLLQHRQIRQIACPGPRDLHTLDFRIMTDHASPVPGLADIALEAVASVFECKIKRSKSIFRDGAG